MKKEDLTELYFMDIRSKLLDVSAYFDRIHRSKEGEVNFKYQDLKKAVDMLQQKLAQGEDDDITAQLLTLFSDQSEQVKPSGKIYPPACGTVDPSAV